MRYSSLCIISVFFHFCVFGVNALFAQQCLVPPSHHPWGRFHVGSWKKVRVVTEDLDEAGKIIGTTKTETTTKLVHLDKTSYTLSITVNVEIAGKQLSKKTQNVRKGFSGENVGDSVKVETVGKAIVHLDGVSIPSEVRRIVVDSGGGQRVTTIHYSKNVVPFVLRRETKSTAAGGMSTTFTSRGKVLASEMPFPILSEYKRSSIVQTVHGRPGGKTTTTEIYSLDVPGGVVAHTSNETNEAGRVVRKSRLELVNFQVVQESPPQKFRLRDRLRLRRGSR